MNKSFIKVIFTLGNILIAIFCHAQVPTIGLIYSGTNVSDGYTLFTPEQNNTAYLINNCGEKVKEWNFYELPGVTCYLLENGSILRAGLDSLTIHDWDDNLVWSFATSDIGINQNHDIEPLPNGNVLCIVSKTYTSAQIIAEGRNPAFVGTSFKIEKIVEIQPVGLHGGTRVWEWNFMNHFIQDFDSTKNNYGVVEDHPELMDVNNNETSLYDWSHSNSIDYNPVLDQILFSSRSLNEIFIIDHSTTMAEAAGHTGGNSNKGGDFLWRWGNTKAYRQGGIQDQKLFAQHDAKWVESGYTDEGKITVFNNGDSTSTFSSVGLITPEIINNVYTKINNKFAPLDFEWTWNGSILGNIMHEGKKSGIQSQPNGNLVIAESSLGRFSEITKTGILLWSYLNPTGYSIYNQFDNVTIGDNTIFKAEKYPSNFVGFSGKDLTPQGLIENQNSFSSTCISNSDIEKSESEKIFIQNPIVNRKIQFNQNVNYNFITITDINGRVVYKHGIFNGNNFEVDLNPAMYFIQLCSDKKIINSKIIVL